MQEQVKKLQTVVEHLQRKTKNQNLVLECYEVFSECVLIVQREVNIEVGSIMDRLFVMVRDMLEQALSLIKPPPEPQQILVASHIPAFVNALQLGSVSILDQLGTPRDVKNIHQIEWCDYKCKGPQTRNLRHYQDASTSTLLDYYQECQRASSTVQRSQEELRDLIEFTNDTIDILSEALANKKQLDIEYAGKPGDLDLAISEIQFRRLNFDQFIRSVHMEQLGVQNYDHTVQFLMQHIHQIQQQTALAILARIKVKEKEKQQQVEAKVKTKKKPQVNDCRCSQYVNDIMQLKNKLDQQLIEIAKRERQILELEVMNEQKEIQFRMAQQQIMQLDSDKMEFKSKFDAITREYGKLVKKNSDRGYMTSSSNDEIAGVIREQSQSSHRYISKENLLTPQPTPKDNYLIQKKTQQMERLVKLVNALDSNNQTRRLTQMQIILDQKGSSQIHELADLIKEIEENDLVQNNEQPNAYHSTLNFEQSIKNLDSKHQSFYEFDNNDSRPAIKVSVPTESQYQGTNRSSTNSQKKVESFGYLRKEADNLKVMNTSPNQLSPHYPMAKAKSSSNLLPQAPNLIRQNSIKTIKPKVALHPVLIDQCVQTEWTVKDTQIQTERAYSRQVSEQLETTRIGNWKGTTTTTNSTFHVGTAQSTPSQSNPTSNLPSPRNINSQNSTHPPNLQFQNAILISQNNGMASPRNRTLLSQGSGTPSTQGIRGTYQSPHLKSVISESEYSQQQSVDLKMKDRQKRDIEKLQKHRRMQTATQSQNTSPVDDAMIEQVQNQMNEQMEEERLMYNEALHDVPEQNELEIIQKAVNRVPGYELAPEITENILHTMYGNLERNPDIVNLIKQMSKNPTINFTEFKRFVNKMQAFHKRCGRDCNHLMRFYMRLGFVNIKYLNKRKLLKLGKPKVLPGFK